MGKNFHCFYFISNNSRADELTMIKHHKFDKKINERQSKTMHLRHSMSRKIFATMCGSTDFIHMLHIIIVIRLASYHHSD